MGELTLPGVSTVTVVVAVAVLLPVAVKVYFVVVVGLTVVEPDAETIPIPWSIETVVAFVVVHVNVELFPAIIVAGDADRVAVGAAACTVTVATDVTVPLPVAVSVYSVVAVGLTVVEPDAATTPMPSSMETEVAFDVVHVSVAWFPGVIVEGETERVAVVTAGGNEGNIAVPRQPDIRPSERLTAMNDKHIVGKRTLHHPLGTWQEPWQNYEIKPGRTKSENPLDFRRR